MADPARHLKEWTEAGLIDPATAGRIREYETRPAPSAAARPGVIEVLLYLGVAVLGVGVFSLVTQNWAELESAARVTVVGMPALVCLGAGALMRGLPSPGTQRAGGSAWFAAVALCTGTLASVLYEYEPLGVDADDERALLLIVGSFALALSLALWAVNPSSPQLLAMGASLVFFAQALGAWPDDFSVSLAAGTLIAVAAAALVVTELGALHPRESARFVFSAIFTIGSIQIAFEGQHMAWELFGLAAGVVLLGLGVARSTFVYVVVGVVGLFATLVQFIFNNFSEELGAPLALIICGAGLIAGLLLLARLGPRRLGGASL